MPPSTEALLARTTPDLIAGGNSAYHLRPEVGDPRRPYSDEAGNPWVSSRSRWRDERWYLDNPTPGVDAKGCQVLWRRRLPDGSFLTDPRHARLLEAFRRALWSLLVDPRSGRGLTAGSMGHISRGIYLLVWWMKKNDYEDFSQLDAKASAEFEGDLVKLVHELNRSRTPEETEEVGPTDADDDLQDEEQAAAEDLRDLGITQAYDALRVWAALWRQSGALAEAGVPTLPEAPFRGRSAAKVASALAEREVGRVPPLPDEVAAPVMAAAYRLIGQAADDVIALQQIYLDARDKLLRWSNDQTGRVGVRRAVDAFRFSVLPSEAAPWHEPLRSPASKAPLSAEGDKGQALVLRGLVRAIREAAVIVLQSSSGQRINEICGLLAGVNPSTGLPACIEIRPSHSGLSELFYLRGVLSKLRAAPVNVEWLIGSRPAGSDWTPPPVRALAVLQRLFEPWREMADDAVARRSLIVSFATQAGGGLPASGGSVGRPTAERLLAGQQEFVRRFVDLSGLPKTNARGEDLGRYRDSQGTCITTHQWRKTYALYLFRINKKMLPAISQQFKHLGIAMTERSYIGNDPTLLRDIDSVHVQQTVAFWANFTPGKRMPVAGRMGAIIERYRPEIEKLVAGLEVQEATDAIEAWVLRHDLRIFHNPDGKCLIRANPSAARCHEAAGTSDWKNKSPNYGARDTSICLGCNAFAIDGEHTEFWTLRYAQNQAAWLAAQAAGDTRGYRAVKKRADQAKAVLRTLRVPVPDVEVPRAA